MNEEEAVSIIRGLQNFLQKAMYYTPDDSDKFYGKKLLERASEFLSNSCPAPAPRSKQNGAKPDNS